MRRPAYLMNETKLPARLQCIADSVLGSRRFIDVGSDHGYLSAYILESGKADRVVCTDIHRAPAERTAAYLRSRGFSDRSDVFCTDGLSDVRITGEETVVIAGIGGLEIIHILTDALAEHGGVLPEDTVILLQPQRSDEELRAFLCGNGFEIVFEKICRDRGKVYIILAVKFTGKPILLSSVEKILGPYILRNKPEGTVHYFSAKLRLLENQKLGRPELERVILHIEELMKENGGNTDE